MTFTEAENAYLASQRLGRRPHRPRRQPQVKPVGFYYNPKLGTIDVTGFTMATNQKFRNARRNARPRSWSMTSPRPTMARARFPGDPGHRLGPQLERAHRAAARRSTLSLYMLMR